jgi:5-methylcytosine-specific restriction enzyme A
MTAVLLGWNPAHWDDWQPSYPEAILEVARTGVFRGRWTVSDTRRIPVGADAWLLLQGSIRGLIGHATVTSTPYREADHARPGRANTYVNVDFDALLSIGDQIPFEVLIERAPNAGWTTPHGSGHRVPEIDEPTVRAVWAEHTPSDENDPILPTPGTFPEEALTRVVMNRYERDPHARRLCLAHYGTSCAACGFSFEAAYGQGGEGFIHIHQLVPLSQLGPGYELDPIRDLIPLCPNCHYMAHRRQVPYTPSELRRMMKNAGHIGGTIVTDDQLVAEETAKRILEG